MTGTAIDLDAITLASGAHATRDEGMCIEEAAAYYAGEPHTDHPACTSPVIAAFLRRWNDDLDDTGRQNLKRFIPMQVGTNTGADDDGIRAWMVTDWMVRTYLPAWLRLAGMNDQADVVAASPELVDAGSWSTAEPAVKVAYQQAAAAGAAAGDAAWAAAWAAAWDAARAAAWAAAWDAARAAAWDAARAAARDVLRPTVESLQQSAEQLLERLCAVGRAA